MRVVVAFVIAGIVLSACGSSQKPAASGAVDPRTKDPCVSYEPESFAAGWSLPDDRRCATSDDCVVAIVRFEDVHCSFGWYGTSASAVSSKSAESRVQARLRAIEPCQLHEHMRARSVCASPPLECAGGLCGFKDEPPHIAF